MLCCAAGIITIKTEPHEEGKQPDIVEIEPNVYKLRHCSVIFPEQYTAEIHETMDDGHIIAFDCANGNWGRLFEFDCFPYADIHEFLKNEEIPITFQVSKSAKSSLEIAEVDLSSFVLKSSKRIDVMGSEFTSSYVLRGAGKVSSPNMYVVAAVKWVGSRNYLLVTYYSMRPIEGPSEQRWEITKLLNSIKPNKEYENRF